MINLESQAKVLCCARCMEKKYNAASQKNYNTDQRVTTTAYRGKKRVKLLGRVVTKHQLPEPSPHGSNHPQR